jgi:hypothetical protein
MNAEMKRYKVEVYLVNAVAVVEIPAADGASAWQKAIMMSHKLNYKMPKKGQNIVALAKEIK